MYRETIKHGVIMIMMILNVFWGTKGHADSVREPAVSGTWYPSSESALKEDVRRYLEQADLKVPEGKLIGFVSPHAGFVFSGPVAAYDYKIILGKSYDLVILIGNAHRVGFKGAALDLVDKYRTPLGMVDVDTAFLSDLVSPDNDVVSDSRPHRPEHSLEAQIPFLQYALKPGFKIAPILFGYAPGKAYRYLVEAIPRLVRGKSCLIIGSTDLTHFPDYETSCRIDSETVKAIASMDPVKLERIQQEEAGKAIPGLECVLCGDTATKVVMEIVKALGADKGIVLKRANSGDIYGDRQRVVGYGAVAFFDTHPDRAEKKKSKERLKEPVVDERLSVQDQKELLGISRYVLEKYVKSGDVPKIDIKNDRYLVKRGVFVTLKIKQHLRGCIGYIMPRMSLIDAVVENTVNACAKDPRFSPVTSRELDDIDIEISVLTPPHRVSSYRDIKIGTHGIILKKGFYQAVFLPQVAPEQGWDLETTLTHLSLKAGMRSDSWKDGAEFEVFEAQVFGENEFGRQSWSP